MSYGWDDVARSGSAPKSNRGGKPPKKGGCGKRAAAILFLGSASVVNLGNAIVQSFI